MTQGKMRFDLSQRVALVTGGGSGLGRVFSEALAECGANVAIADVDEKKAKETAEIVREFGQQSLEIKTNVNNPDDVQHMVDETVANFGKIDILVNNAGISAKPGKIADMPIEEWDRVLGIDLRGVFFCTRAVLPQMVKQRKGNIINIASVLGIRAFLEVAEIMPSVPYSIAKAGVIMLTKVTAVEYARDGIRANCIAPGWHSGTRLTSRWQEMAWQEEQLRKYEEMIVRITPMGRRGEPSELKGLIVYLASDASSFMTGQVLVSDGGVYL